MGVLKAMECSLKKKKNLSKRSSQKFVCFKDHNYCTFFLQFHLQDPCTLMIKVTISVKRRLCVVIGAYLACINHLFYFDWEVQHVYTGAVSILGGRCLVDITFVGSNAPPHTYK